MATAKKITIHDVALAAGVSVSTVSLVLSGKGRISTATGERVNAAIEELGFVRNRQASALRGGQSGVIGLIVRDLSAPFYAELTAGLTEALDNEQESLPELIRRTTAACESLGKEYEILLIDDGSSDNSAHRLTNR